MRVSGSFPRRRTSAFPSAPAPHDGACPPAEGRVSRHFSAERRSQETYWGATGSCGYRFPSSYSYSTPWQSWSSRRRNRPPTSRHRPIRSHWEPTLTAALQTHIQNPDREGRKKSKQIRDGAEARRRPPSAVGHPALCPARLAEGERRRRAEG
jgi:hypothetical protein